MTWPACSGRARQSTIDPTRILPKYLSPDFALSITTDQPATQPLSRIFRRMYLASPAGYRAFRTLASRTPIMEYRSRHFHQSSSAHEENSPARSTERRAPELLVRTASTALAPAHARPEHAARSNSHRRSRVVLKYRIFLRNRNPCRTLKKNGITFKRQPIAASRRVTAASRLPIPRPYESGCLRRASLTIFGPTRL